MLIIADNSNTTDIDKILIENDLSGRNLEEIEKYYVNRSRNWKKFIVLLFWTNKGDRVTIPVVLISKSDGELLKKFLV